MTTASPQAAEVAQESDDTGGETLVLQTKPTIRPVLIQLGLTLLVGAVAVGVLFFLPELLGSPENTNVALVVVQVLVAIAALRLVVKTVVLRATTYVLTDRSVRREFELLARSKSREVPYDLVRSHQRSQDRIEYLLDVGSVSLNQGLGDLRLEMLADHDAVYRRIRERVDAA